MPSRFFLIHEYFRVDLEMAWDMVRKDLPLLEAEVRGILQELHRDDGAV